MKTLRRATRAVVICGALALTQSAIVPAATAQEVHDGIWRVATQPITGPCSKSFEFNLAVEDGQISYAGIWPVDASGSVNPVGVIEISIIRGQETLSAKGMVRGDVASGKWVSPVKNCTGSWIARKG